MFEKQVENESKKVSRGGAQVEGGGEGGGGENLSSLHISSFHISKVVFYISLKEY